MTSKKTTITKQEAARSQLETAIKLYFENRDLISAYTLCSAANGILEGIYENEREIIIAKQLDRHSEPTEIQYSWNEEWEMRFKPEYLIESFRLLNATQNFLKHADKDHDSIHEYDDWEETGARIFLAYPLDAHTH